jgi:choline dehydrogenase-like flavoprotein
MVFNRASKEEYDAWSEIGNDGWDWNNLLPSFKSSSNYSAITDSDVFPGALNASDATSREQSFIGTSGEIHVSPSPRYE